MLASTASESLDKTKSESLNVPVSSLNVPRIWALAHQASQNGTLTTSGLLK